VPHKLVTFVRHNAIALLALFVALGGTSYAALNLPANSVGSKQIRNRSITPVKLDPSRISASISAWAIVYGDTTSVSPGPASSQVRVQRTGTGESITWLHRRFSTKCFPMVTPRVAVNSIYNSVSVDFQPASGTVLLYGFRPGAVAQQVPVYAMVVCP
jgi:hypothetical protein